MRVGLVKAKRYARRIPAAAARDYVQVLASRDQFFALSLALMTSYIGLRTAALPKLVEQADQWADVIQAFVYVALGWAVICLFRAPFVVYFDEKRKGAWHGNTYVYREPVLLAVIRCSGGSEDHQHSFRAEDPEVDTMLYCSVEMHPPVDRFARPQVFGMLRTGSPPQPGSWSEFRLERNRRVNLYIHMLQPCPPFTARVYCHQFQVDSNGRP